MNPTVETVLQAAKARLRDEPALAVEQAVAVELGRRAPLLDSAAAEAVTREVLAELVGLGPIEPLLRDPAVTEVMVNRGTELWVDRDGSPERAGALEPGQLEALLERIIAPLGLRLDRSRPIVDARLPDGSRLCAVVPPLAADGPCCAIRRFRVRTVDLVAMAGPTATGVLERLVSDRANIVVSGATSSGKTTLLNALAGFIPAGERLVTIEDTAELRLDAPHVLRLEARPASEGGPAAIGVRELVRTALRLRPDRLIVGEVRGPEALDMIQALNTGHDGSLTTCHANGPLDALRRLEAMVLMAAPSWPPTIAREQVHASIDAIVHLQRGPGGRRRVDSIVEVAPPETLADGRRITVLADADGVHRPFRRRRP